jgi:hypothetical protein
VPNDDVFSNLTAVLDRILAAAERPYPAPLVQS